MSYFFPRNLDDFVRRKRERVVAEIGVGQRLEDPSRLRALNRDHGHLPRRIPNRDVIALQGPIL